MNISRSSCQTTAGIGGVSFLWSPVCYSQFRSEDVAILVKILGCDPDTTSHTVLCVLLMISPLSFRFAPPGKKASLLHWLKHNIPLWSGSFFHVSHSVEKQFLAFVLLYYCCHCFCCYNWYCWEKSYWRLCFCSQDWFVCPQLALSFSAGCTDFYITLAFYSSITLFWVCRRWCFWDVGLQYSFVAQKGLPSHSILIHSLGV